MESLSVHLMWVAAATYCTLLAPKNLLATLIGVVGMAHFSIGWIYFSVIYNFIVNLLALLFSRVRLSVYVEI